GANGCDGDGLVEYAGHREIPAVEGPAMSPSVTHSTQPHPEGSAAAADRIVILDRRGAPKGGHRHQSRRGAVVVESKIDEVVAVLLDDDPFLLVAQLHRRIELRLHLEVDIRTRLEQANPLVGTKDIVLRRAAHDLRG